MLITRQKRGYVRDKKKGTSQIQKFNQAIAAILQADPKAVKAAVDAEIQVHTAEREAKGERKRGRKPKVKKNDN